MSRRLPVTRAPTRASAAGSVLLALSLLLGGCERPAAPPGPPDPASLPPPPVDVAPAVERDIRDIEELVGRLEAPESVDVRARVEGNILEIHFDEGEVVERGDLLVTIDPRPYRAALARAEADLSGARSQQTLARLELERAKELLDKRLGSRQEYDQRAAELRYAEERVRSAEAALESSRLDLEYTEIRAPIEGRISRAEVTAGNLVRFGEPVLTRIVSEDRVYAVFEVSERVFLDLFGATSGPGARLPEVRMGLENEAGHPHEGRIDFVDNRLNPATATMRVRAVFDNAERRFTPGLVARIQLASSEPRSAVLTPDRAIGTDQDKKFVLVVDAQGVAQFRPVRLGALHEGMRVVLEGLEAGEQVVVAGLQRARPGAPVTPVPVPVDERGMPLAAPSPEEPGSPPAS